MRPHKLASTNERRKNKRIELRFRIKIEIPKMNGRVQSFTAETISVSKSGAIIDCNRELTAGMGIQIKPPFGEPILAEVNEHWIDKKTGNQHVSIRLIDPQEWSSPLKGVVERQLKRRLHPVKLNTKVYHQLKEYIGYLCETDRWNYKIRETIEMILEKHMREDQNFQKWQEEKIMEELQAWQDKSVTEEVNGNLVRLRKIS
jgi:uncharacterized protein YbaR (Trm112 family)